MAHPATYQNLNKFRERFKQQGKVLSPLATANSTLLISSYNNTEAILVQPITYCVTCASHNCLNTQFTMCQFSIVPISLTPTTFIFSPESIRADFSNIIVGLEMTWTLSVRNQLIDSCDNSVYRQPNSNSKHLDNHSDGSNTSMTDPVNRQTNEMSSLPQYENNTEIAKNNAVTHTPTQLSPSDHKRRNDESATFLPTNVISSAKTSSKIRGT